MFKITRWLCTLLCAVSVTLAAPETNTIRWEKNYEQALKAASNGGKMILVDFYADWCGWCRKLDETTYKDKNVIAASRDFINVKVDVDRQASLTQKFSIGPLPTIVFLDSAGEEITRSEGYLPAAEFLNAMRDARKTLQDFKDALKKLEKNSDDVDANYQVGRVYLKRRDTTKAKGYVDKVLALDPENRKNYAPELLLQMGLAHGIARNFEHAIEIFSNAVKNYPKSQWFEQTKLYLGMCYQFTNQMANAERIYRELAETAKSEEIRQAARNRLSQLPHP